MSHSTPLLAATSPLLSSGSALIDTQPAWHELVAWTHSWDALDAVTYIPGAAEQSEFGVTTAPRVASIQDRGAGGKPLTKDPGMYGPTYGTTNPLPGPLLISESARFNNRSACRFDTVTASLGAVLSPVADWTNSAYWLGAPTGLAQPVWVAVLSSEGMTIDSTLGSDGDGPTFGPGAGGGFGTAGKWACGCWGTNNHNPPYYLNAGHNWAADEAVLGIVYWNGASSFMEVNFRWADGSLHTERVNGLLDAWTWKTCFWGWVDKATHNTAIGIKTGTPSEADLTKIRSWAARYMPPKGVT